MSDRKQPEFSEDGPAGVNLPAADAGVAGSGESTSRESASRESTSRGLGSVGRQDAQEATDSPMHRMAAKAELADGELSDGELAGGRWPDEEFGLADTVDVSSTVDELVVYLDGYLDDEQRRRVERRLLEDESARADLASLQSSWDALDALPRESCSVDFTESTMKLVVQRELATESRWKGWRKWVAPLVVAAGLLLSLGMGYMWARQAQTADEREFLESYRLIRDWEKYELLGDFDFLLRLEKEGLFTREVNHVAP